VFVVLSGLGGSLLGGVGDGDLATGTGHPGDLELESADALHNLGLGVLELEDAAVIVVQDHDGGHVGGAELEAGHHRALHVHLGNLDAVLPPWVGDPDVEVFVLFKDVVVHDF